MRNDLGSRWGRVLLVGGLAMFVLAAAGCESDSSEPSSSGTASSGTTVPLRRDSVDALVHLSIGRHDSLRFVLDSGGSSLVLSRSLFHRLGAVASVVDTVNQVPRVQMDRVRLGSVVIDSPTAVVAAPPLTVQRRWESERPYDGILGWGALSTFDVAYDLVRQRLVLFPSASRPPRQSPVWSVVPDSFACASFPYFSAPYQYESGHFPRLSVKGTSFPVLLDTGASPSVLSWRVARAAGITRASAHRLDERTRGLDTSAVGAVTYGAPVEDAQLRSISLSPARVRVSDVSWFDEGGYQALIGNDLLAGRLVVRADSAGRQRQYVCGPTR